MAYMQSLCNVSNVYIVLLVSSPVDETIVVYRMVSPIKTHHIVSYKNASMYQKHQDNHGLAPYPGPAPKSEMRRLFWRK